MRKTALVSLVALYISFLISLYLLPTVNGTNVAAFTGATIDGAVLPLALPKPLRHFFSIACGRIYTITVTGNCVPGATACSAELMDSDIVIDDKLDEKTAPCVGGVFTLGLQIYCESVEHSLWDYKWTSKSVVGPAGSSGEQTAEIYVKDGSQVIPTPNRYWEIACDEFEWKKHTEITTDTVIQLYRANFWVPAYALSEPKDFINNNTLPIPSPENVPSSFSPISEAFYLGPDDVVFAKEVIVLVSYSEGEVEGLLPDTLKIFRYDSSEGMWNPVETSIDTEHGILTFNATKLGTFGFTGKTASVGGVDVPVDRFALLTLLLAPYIPYVALTSTILVATAATAVYVKRVKHRKDKQ
jgi:hypothetical protein